MVSRGVGQRHRSVPDSRIFELYLPAVDRGWPRAHYSGTLPKLQAFRRSICWQPVSPPSRAAEFMASLHEITRERNPSLPRQIFPPPTIINLPCSRIVGYRRLSSLRGRSCSQIISASLRSLIREPPTLRARATPPALTYR